MFFLITFSSTLYADAPGPINLSLKGIVDWVRFFQFVEYGTALPSTPSTRGVWFILWVNNEPALYWSNGSEWIPFVTAGVQAGSIDTDALADGAVTTPKLANSAVDTDKINNGAVTTNKIADNAVTGTKFANNSITTAKLANSSVTSEKLGYLSVGTINIQNGAVTSEKISSIIENKNIVLNDGTTSNPSLSFSSNQTSGLSYDSSSNTVNISISASDKVKIGNTSTEFINMPEGITISSFSEKLTLNSDGLNKDDLSLTLNGDIIASGSLLPSENIMFNLGSNSKKWNNLYVGNIFSDNEYVITTSLVPEVDNTGYVGSDTMRWGNMNAVNASFTLIDTDSINVDNASVTNLLSNSITSPNIISDIVSTDNLLAIDSNIQNLEVVNSIYPSVDNSVEIGTSTLKIKSGDYYSLNVDNLNTLTLNLSNFQTNQLIVENASVSHILEVSDIIASESIETDYITGNTASFTNVEIVNASISKILLDSELVSSGTVNVSKILIDGEPLVSDVNMKFPNSLAVIDIEASKYSLKDNANLQNDYSQTWQYTSYAEDGDGLYMTYKNDVTVASSCYVTTFDTFDFSNAIITLRLNASNLSLGTSNANITPLLSIASGTASFISIVRDTDGKLNIKNIANSKVIDTDYTVYDWNETHDIFLIAETSTNNMYLYIDGDLIEEFTLNGTSSMANSYCQIVIGGQNPDSIDNNTLPDYNIRFRKIQVYNRNLKIKEMKSLPTIEAVAKLNRKNTTNPPCYTLGEPSTLIGGDFDSGEGYFGTVTGDKFIYPWEVLGQLWGMDMNVIDTKAKFIASFTNVFDSNISYTFTGDSYTALGVTDNLEVEWLKFYDHGYLIFIPKRPLLNNITWEEINNTLANCTVGKEIKIDLRRMNPLIDSTYSNGNLISVRCRLLTGGNIQPFIYGNVNEKGIKDNSLCMGSEWNRLMYRICEQIPSDTFAGNIQGHSGGKQLGDNWFNFTGSDLGFGASNDLGRFTFIQEYCYYQNTVYALFRVYEASVGAVSYSARTSRNTNRGFRPALVLKVSNQ